MFILQDVNLTSIVGGSGDAFLISTNENFQVVARNNTSGFDLTITTGKTLLLGAVGGATAEIGPTSLGFDSNDILRVGIPVVAYEGMIQNKDQIC